jgi:hypothetical protein
MQERLDSGSGTSKDEALKLWQVLRDEYRRLRPRWDQLSDEALEKKATPPERTELLYECAHSAPNGERLSGLCLSGGGIRSATFNLGVIQGLAERGLLRKFDYLSSVSGGGYISSWLSAWLHRAKSSDDVFHALGEPKRPKPETLNPLRPEPGQIEHLRRYSNYLTPRLGALSLDTWTSVAIVVRNIFLNWLVYVPILAAVLATPLLALASWDSWIDAEHQSVTDLPMIALAAIACSLGLASSFLMHVLRANNRPLNDPSLPWWARRPVTYTLIPLGGAVAVIGAATRCTVHFWEALVPSAVWAMLLPTVAFLTASHVQERIFAVKPVARRSDLMALLASGIVQSVIYAGLWSQWGGQPWQHHADVVLLPALILLPALLAKALFVGFASVAESRSKAEEAQYRATEYGDAQREWWARWSAWVLVGIAVWTGLAAIVCFSPWFLGKQLEAYGKVAAWVTTLGLGKVLSSIGASAKTPGKGESDGGWLQILVTWGVPIFCVLLAVLLSCATQDLLAWVGSNMLPHGAIRKSAAEPLVAPAWFVGCAILVMLGIGVGSSYFINVNRFSLQAFYRNRLVRAYLGASRTDRTPNWFTGFDPHDNLYLWKLATNRPLPVVNMTLNLVNGGDLAWQERKAESFTATPLHCGSARVGYWPADTYGGQEGISVGTAVAISGAAANPNMGSNSSPAVGFLMTLFNARLGAWLPNPGPEGKTLHSRGGPWGMSWYYSLAEAFGWTNDTATFVNLSDGGHFENLGLYEMVRRRCHTIVVSDAGQDGHCRFDDLGNAIRKIRIDFGISITFEHGIHIVPKDQPDPHAGYCAVGTINYGDVDPKGKPGTLIYLKPAISGDEPYDVFNYARASTDFPHETTADQWFSESQFESYRVLGRNALMDISKDTAGNFEWKHEAGGFEEFVCNVRRYLAARARVDVPMNGDRAIGDLPNLRDRVVHEHGNGRMI